MWAMAEADGPLPVSVPQSGWDWANVRDMCDYLQMIQAEHRQCLEEAELENETAGESPASPPPPGRGALQTPRSPSSHSASPDPYHTHCIVLEGAAPWGCWVVRRGCWEKLGSQTKKEGANRTPCSHHSPLVWGAPSCYLRRVYKLGFRRVSAAGSAFGGLYPSSPGKGVMSSWLPSPCRL